MPNSKSTLPVIASTGIGVLLFIIAAVATQKREPWDASFYWVVSYPLAIAASAALGYHFPERPWRWPLWLFEAQFVSMAVRNGELGNLWPIGMALFAVVALPAILAAKWASRFSDED